jgi:hypothetical protein
VADRKSTQYRIARDVVFISGAAYYTFTPSLDAEDPNELWRSEIDGPASNLGFVNIEHGCTHPYLMNLRAYGQSIEATAYCYGLATAYSISIDVSGRALTAKILRALPSYWDDDLVTPNSKSGWQAYLDETNGCAGFEILDGRPTHDFAEVTPASLFGWAISGPALASPNSPCPSGGQAGYLSSDQSGDLFFLATPEPASSKPDADSSWTLYRWTAASHQVASILSNFESPASVAVSSDGTQILIAARYRGSEGLWLVTASARSVVRVTGESLLSVTFAANHGFVASSADGSPVLIAGPLPD